MDDDIGNARLPSLTASGPAYAKWNSHIDDFFVLAHGINQPLVLFVAKGAGIQSVPAFLFLRFIGVAVSGQRRFSMRTFNLRTNGI